MGPKLLRLKLFYDENIALSIFFIRYSGICFRFSPAQSSASKALGTAAI